MPRLMYCKAKEKKGHNIIRNCERVLKLSNVLQTFYKVQNAPQYFSVAVNTCSCHSFGMRMSVFYFSFMYKKLKPLDFSKILFKKLDICLPNI